MQADQFVQAQLPPMEQWPELIYLRPELRFGPNLNCVKTLFEQAFDRGFGDSIFLRSNTQQLSYEHVYRQVLAVAGQLQAQGLVPGNRVLLRGGNTIGLAIAWLAIAHCGLVVVATMPLLRAKELGEIIAKAEVSFALCDSQLLDELQQAQASKPSLRKIIEFSAQGQFHFNTEANAFDANQYCASTDDIALLAFTSGTTGTPKAAIHSHRDILAACECWPIYNLQATPDDIVLGSPPLAFTFGLGGLLLFPLRAGCSVYYPDKAYSPESMLEAIHQIKASICYTAPTFYRQMTPLIQTRGTARLRMCVSAGEMLPQATRDAWKVASGIDLIDGIGATELFHIFITSKPGDLRPGSLGQIVPGYVAKVVDEQGLPVAAGTVGRLAVRGPTGCRYLGDARQTQYVKHGWNFPGDAFYCDADGYYFYQARTDDMIISAGYNIAGPEVENCLLQHEAVAECAVVGAPDEARGTVVQAFVVLRPPAQAGEATVKQLQDWVKQQLAPYKYPRSVVFVAQLPKTETGKLQRFKLRT
jgi:2-aminobenzoate-CoA ligase